MIQFQLVRSHLVTYCFQTWVRISTAPLAWFCEGEIHVYILMTTLPKPTDNFTHWFPIDVNMGERLTLRHLMLE